MIVYQADRQSALVRAALGPDYHWGLPEQLLAIIADALHGANWQRAQGAPSERPKPIPRPGIEQPKQIGRTAVSIEEAQERLARKRQT